MKQPQYNKGDRVMFLFDGFDYALPGIIETVDANGTFFASLEEIREQKLAYFRELLKCRKKLKPFREQASLNPGAMALLEQIQKEIDRMVEFLDEYEWMTSDEKKLMYEENMESYIPDVPPEKKFAVERIHREEYPELGLKRMISHANYIGGRGVK